MPIDESRAFIPVRIAVLTISDTRGLAEDRSGDTLIERLEKAGHILAARSIERDDKLAIVARLHAWIDDGQIDVILTTGGTGVTGRDVKFFAAGAGADLPRHSVFAPAISDHKNVHVELPFLPIDR